MHQYLCLHMKKQYFEDFTLKRVLLLEICAREKCEKFVNKHSETLKISLHLKKFTNYKITKNV